MTEEECDATLVRDCGVSYDEMRRLNLYWRRMLLGYTPKPPEEPPEVVRARIMEQLQRHGRGGPQASGWRVG